MKLGSDGTPQAAGDMSTGRGGKQDANGHASREDISVGPDTERNAVRKLGLSGNKKPFLHPWGSRYFYNLRF